MALRITSRQTKILDLGEGGQLEVLTDISKGSFNTLLRHMPADIADDDRQGFTPVEADEFTIGLFQMFVKGWNATDENGNEVPATLDNYLLLEREAATVIDTALMEHFNSLSPTREETTKSPKAR